MSRDVMDYLGLIGLYVRAERPATEAEYEDCGSETMGGEGVVAGVVSRGPHAVEIILEDNTPIIVAAHETWVWAVYRRAPVAMADPWVPPAA